MSNIRLTMTHGRVRELASQRSNFAGNRLRSQAVRVQRPAVKVAAVEANLFSRVARIFKSYANSVVSAAEDPEKILDQVVEDMQADVIRMRQASAQAMASGKQLEKRYLAAQEQVDEWLRRAELALKKGDEELAREALSRKQTFQKTADQLKAQWEQQKTAVQGLITNTQQLEAKLADAKAKKDTLKARAASAKTSKQVQEMVGSLDTSSAVAAFDRMEEKVITMEAEAESVGELVGGSSLDKKFAALEAGSVEDELAKLKSGALGSGSSSRAALPEGRPVQDALDLELEQLRKKARN